MSRVRVNSFSRSARLHTGRRLKAIPGYAPPPGACVGTVLGERLGIAAIYAGHEDADNARSAALLAVTGLPDTPANRAAVLASIDAIEAAVRGAVGASTRTMQ